MSAEEFEELVYFISRLNPSWSPQDVLFMVRTIEARRLCCNCGGSK